MSFFDKFFSQNHTLPANTSEPDDNAVTIKDGTFLRQILLKKLHRPSQRIDFMINDFIKAQADRELVDTYLSYMREIEMQRRNSYNGRWQRERTIPYSHTITKESKLICESVG